MDVIFSQYNALNIDTPQEARWMQLPCLKVSQPPTAQTRGAVGLFAMVEGTGAVYKCIAADDVNGVYAWADMGLQALNTSDEQEHAVLGDDIAVSGIWTSDGWTGSFANGFTHTNGNTNSLRMSMPGGSAGKTYQVQFETSAAPTSDPVNIAVRIGGSELFSLYGQVYPISVGIKSVDGGDLEFVPSANFTGTINNITVREIIDEYEGGFVVHDSQGNEAFAIRTTKGAEDPESDFNYNSENNVFLGVKSGGKNTSGYGNVGFGSLALKENTSGFWNTAIGNRTLQKNLGGSRNIGIGYGALQENTYGQRNIGIGTYALMYHTKGNWNIAIGSDCQMNRANGDSNVGIGHAAMNTNSGSLNVAIGREAMYASASGSNDISIGYAAGYYVSGQGNVCVGGSSGKNNKTGNYNVFIGANAGQGPSSGYNGEGNIAIGQNAGQKLACGAYSGYNTIIGCKAGTALTTGCRCILIGTGVEAETATGNDQLNIGNLLRGIVNKTSADRYLLVDGGFRLPEIPTADPQIAGAVWNDNGTLKVSVGA